MQLTDAQRELVEQNLKLAALIARDHHRRLPANVERDDIDQAARMGLIDAALRFDAARGATFETFARWRINGAVRDYLRSLDCVSKEERAKINAGEASERVELRVDDLYLEPRAVQRTPEEASMAAQFAAQLRNLVEGLSGRQRTIVRQYYYHDQAMAAIGEDLGVGEARISQVHKRAIETLRAEPAFVARKAVFRFAMNSGLFGLLAIAFAFAPAADAQTSQLDLTARGCRGNAVQVVLSVPLAAGAISVPVPVCAELGAGLTLNTSANPPRLEVVQQPALMPRAVIERFTLPADLPATATTTTFNLVYTPVGAMLGAFRSSRATGDVVDFLSTHGSTPKALTIKVPSYRPFTSDDELSVLYWTLDPASPATQALGIAK